MATLDTYPIITLTTDFGWSEYPAVMKGVIFGINPDANIVDISHSIGSQNIEEGAYVLSTTAHYFKNALHIGVVDPGVGTARKGLIIHCKNGTLIGPDNGLLIPAARKLQIIVVYEITNMEYCLETISDTFHGRDIFAPAAAHISKGVKPDEIGEPTQNYITMDFDDFEETELSVRGRVLYIDNFGNVITNIPQDIIVKHFKVQNPLNLTIKSITLDLKYCRTYGDGEPGKLIGLISSSGYFELAIGQANASEILKTRIGDEIEIFF